MNELIKIEERDGKQLVSARELHEFLEIKTQFSKWFDRMCEYGFYELKDFLAISQKRLTVQGNETTYTDYLITIQMAKELSMIQRNDKGKEAREYFIKCEESWNSDEMIMARALQITKKKMVEYEEKIIQLEVEMLDYKDRAKVADVIEASEDTISIGEMAKILSETGEVIGRNELFQWLRKNGYLMKKDTSETYNQPTQKSMNLGIMELIEKPVFVNPKHIVLNRTTGITGKGQTYLIKRMDKIKKSI